MEKGNWYCAVPIELPPDLMQRANKLALQAANNSELNATIDELVAEKLKNWGGTKPGAVGFTWDVIKRLSGEEANNLLVYTDPIVANWRDGKFRPPCIRDINLMCSTAFRAAMSARPDRQEESPEQPIASPETEPARVTEDHRPSRPVAQPKRKESRSWSDGLGGPGRATMERDDDDKEGPF